MIKCLIKNEHCATYELFVLYRKRSQMYYVLQVTNCTMSFAAAPPPPSYILVSMKSCIKIDLFILAPLQISLRSSTFRVLQTF